MSEGGKIKLFQATVVGNIVVLITGLFLLGSWVEKQNSHVEDSQIHYTKGQLEELYMPRKEVEANFDGLHEKLDILIELSNK